MSKTISHVELTETLALTECNDGFWLYDETRGMNLAMSAKTLKVISRDGTVQFLELNNLRVATV